jgi:predicted nuclease of predicted toxin-antitoxin system
VSGAEQEAEAAASAPPRLLTNENFPRPALLALRAAGLDVESVTERMPGATDAVVLTHAAQTGRWIVTFDRDYGELVFARKVPPPPAIIYLRQGAYALTWPADAVLAVLAQADFAVGHLVVVQDRTLRRRPLPLPASPAP